ncbi:hypothetical protein VTG60DRAFT_560 [Thermothelomyces hinnuleus]
MEPFSTASTFATLIGFSMQLYSACKDYVDAVRGACPNDIKLILVETSSLSASLKAAQDLLPASNGPDADKQKIEESLKECRHCIEQLIKMVPKPMLKAEEKRLSAKEKVDLFLKILSWGPGKKETCATLLRSINTHKATIMFHLTAETSRDVKKIGQEVGSVRTSVQDMQDKLSANERAEICKWLEQVNPSRNHNSAGEVREKETCRWLSDSTEWRSWKDGSGSGSRLRLLWIHGVPGAGKTVLAHTMAEKLAAEARSDGQVGFAYYYCSYMRSQDETAPFLAWIVSQFCRQARYIPATLREQYERILEPSIKDLIGYLEAVLNRFHRAYVVVDAVDESTQHEKLVNVLCILGSDARFAKLRLAITSREMQDIKGAFQHRAIALSMANGGVKEDIRRYVESKLKERPYTRWNQQLRDRAAHLVPFRAEGMFRYAACLLELLAKCGDPGAVSQELNRLPATLDATYVRILEMIDHKFIDQCVRALALTMAAIEDTGPMRAENLVAGVTGGARESFITIEDICNHCICLLRVSNDRTVELAHYTVREFLGSGRLPQHLRAFALSEEKARHMYHKTLMSTAVKFSGSPNVRNMRQDGNGNPVEFHLYTVCRTRVAMFWYREELASNPETRKMLIDLLNPYAPCYPGLQLLGQDGHSDSTHYHLFEWLTRFNPHAEGAERTAAHLTMIVSMRNPSLVTTFLGSIGDKQKAAALFSTEMQVLMPAQWAIFRKSGEYDQHPERVTVLSFYEQGRARGYHTDEVLKMLRHMLPSHQPNEESRPVAGSGNRSSTPTPSHSTHAPLPESRGPTSSSPHHVTAAPTATSAKGKVLPKPGGHSSGSSSSLSRSRPPSRIQDHPSSTSSQLHLHPHPHPHPHPQQQQQQQQQPSRSGSSEYAPAAPPSRTPSATATGGSRGGPARGSTSGRPSSDPAAARGASFGNSQR